MNSIFGEVGVIIIVAAVFALLARLLKQPPLLGYILAGVTLGPLGAHFIQDHQTLDAMQQIGVALLLFLVGLELDWSKAKSQFRNAAVVALLQMVAAFIVGIGIAEWFHYSFLVGIYLGIALSFSSTVIIVKFLSESRDLSSLHGRFAIGITIVQDLFAIIVLVMLGGLNAHSSLNVGDQVLILIVKAAALLSLTYILSQYILPPLFARIARHSELLFMASLGWCFFFALVIHQFNFPIESGAFLAGISLAALPYNLDMVNRLRSLRDFFVVLFFVSVGTTLQVPGSSLIALTVCLVAFTVVIKPIITFFSLSAYGYRSRTSFFAGATQSQMSEFALIIVALGLSRGDIPQTLASVIIFTLVISIVLSTVLHSVRKGIYHFLHDTLRLFERKHHYAESVPPDMEDRLKDHIIILGYHRMGYHILKKLQQLNHHVLVVDFNPDIIRKLRAQQVDCVYGDIEDEEIYDAIHLDSASMVVSTIPHHEETNFLIEEIKKHKSKAKLIVTAHDINDALHYYKEGADYVILPHLLGGEHVADLITRYQDHNLGQYMKHRAEEIKLLRARNHALYFD